MAILYIEMEGTPVAYSRPSFRSKRQPKGVGTPQAQRALQDLSLLARRAVRRFERNSELKWDPSKPVMVLVDFEFPRAKIEGGRGRGHGRTRIEVRQISLSGQAHESVPDLDNLVKLVFESLQHGGVVENDRLVVEIRAGKEKEESCTR